MLPILVEFRGFFGLQTPIGEIRNHFKWLWKDGLGDDAQFRISYTRQPSPVPQTDRAKSGVLATPPRCASTPAFQRRYKLNGTTLIASSISLLPAIFDVADGSCRRRCRTPHADCGTGPSCRYACHAGTGIDTACPP